MLVSLVVMSALWRTKAALSPAKKSFWFPPAGLFGLAWKRSPSMTTCTGRNMLRESGIVAPCPLGPFGSVRFLAGNRALRDAEHLGAFHLIQSGFDEELVQQVAVAHQGLGALLPEEARVHNYKPP